MREYVIARVFTPKPRSLGCGVSFCVMVSCFRIRLAVCQALESSRLKPLLPDSGIWRPGFPGAARDRGQSTVGGSPPTMTTRSEERRGGKACGSKFRSRWCPDYSKKKTKNNH